MLLSTFNLASLLYIQAAWAFPQQTAYTNTTKTSLLGAVPTCMPSCTLGALVQSYIFWAPGKVVTTITAATVVLVVNNRTNTTRTTTIYNTDLAGYTLPDTNSAGTQVTTIVQSDYLAKTNFTTVVAFPTQYEDYPYSFPWSGVVPSTSSGHTTCVTNHGTAELLPSHPPLSDSRSLSIPSDDIKGLTYHAMWEEGACNPKDYLLELFPDVAALSNCTAKFNCAAPASASQTALFLTDTSTSHEAGDDIATAPISAAQLGPSVPALPTQSSKMMGPISSVPSSTKSPDSPSNPPPKTLPPVDSPLSGSPPSNPPPSSGPAPSAPPPSSPPSANSSPPSDQSPSGPPPPNPPPSSGPALSGPPPSSSLSSNPAPPSNPPPSPGLPLSSPPPASAASPSNLPPPSNSPVSNQLPPSNPPPSGSPPSRSPEARPTSAPAAPAVPSNTVVAPAISTPVPGPAPQNPSSDQPAQSLTVGSFILPVSTVAIPTVISGTTTTVHGVALGTQTAPIGSSINIFSTPIVVITSGSSTHIVVGTYTLPLSSVPTPAPIALPAPIVIGSSTVTANSASQYIVSGQTLAPGSTITVGSGVQTTIIALETSNSQTQLVVGSSTLSLISIPTPAPIALPAPIVIGSSTVTANSASQYIVYGQTLAPGSTITIGSGVHTTIIALETPNSQTQLVVGTSTSVLPKPSMPTMTNGPGPITIGTDTITANSLSQYIIASQTLIPGGLAITVSGTPISLAPSATAVIVGTSTSELGGYIMSGIGGSSPTSIGGVQFTGGADPLRVGTDCKMRVVGIVGFLGALGVLV